MPGGQFWWGAILPKSNGGVYQGQLGADGNRARRVMAQAGLTARRTCRAGAKAEHSDPIVGIRRRESSTDKSYSGDNRLVPPKSPYRRRCSAPRCRLVLSWGWRKHIFSPSWKREGNLPATCHNYGKLQLAGLVCFCFMLLKSTRSFGRRVIELKTVKA